MKLKGAYTGKHEAASRKNATTTKPTSGKYSSTAPPFT